VYAEAMAGYCHDRSSGSRIATPHVAVVCIFRQLLLELSINPASEGKAKPPKTSKSYPKPLLGARNDHFAHY